MRRARWLCSSVNSPHSPAFPHSPARTAIYHCLSRVVDRRHAFGQDEREAFRMFMRMYENFTGCRALSYCVMSNHFHLLLEVPPMPDGGLTDAELLKRLSAIYTEAAVAAIAKELAEARAADKDSEAKGRTRHAAEIHARFT
ncbi:MAG: transposase, partial [Akkermansiaceae bacterium]